MCENTTKETKVDKLLRQAKEKKKKAELNEKKKVAQEEKKKAAQEEKKKAAQKVLLFLY
jgi:hypothetical protein